MAPAPDPNPATTGPTDATSASGTNVAADADRRCLTPDEQSYVDRARRAAHELYEGVTVRHRSCGEAIAETFGLPTRAYIGLRKGGITGRGDCGAIRAGELVLAELMSDEGPGPSVSPALRAAVTWYQHYMDAHLASSTAPNALDSQPVQPPAASAIDIRCHVLTSRFPSFASPTRAAFCTSLAATSAAGVAEALCRFARMQRPLYESND